MPDDVNIIGHVHANGEAGEGLHRALAGWQAAKLVRCTGRTFRDIARVEGSKSQDRKIKLITKLLVASKGMEPGYIMRALQVCPSKGMVPR